MKKEQGVQVSRDLATSNITSRQSFKNQLSLFAVYDTEADNKIEELNKSLFTLNDKEAVVFDGLCKLCMDTYDKEHIDLILKIETGQEIYTSVIERQEKTTETHYRAVLSLDEAKAVFCGEKYAPYWDYVFTNIKKLAYDPPKKRRLVLGKKTYIDTEPLRIDLIYEDGSGLKRIANLSPRRKGKTKKEREMAGGKVTSKAEKRIVGFVIEFYKPLFFSIMEKSKKNTQGNNYIRQPPYFHLGIIEEMRQTVEEIKKTDQRIVPALQKAIMEGVQSGTINKDWITREYYENCLRHLQERSGNRLTNVLGISPIEMRKVFTYLALHDNGRGDYITINDLIDFADRCFEGSTEIGRTGERRLYPSRFKELIEQKLMPILFIYKNMMLHGKMDGGQLVPYSIVLEDAETGEKFGSETNSLRIKCLKSKSFFSTYNEASMKDELIDLAGTSAKPQITA